MTLDQALVLALCAFAAVSVAISIWGLRSPKGDE